MTAVKEDEGGCILKTDLKRLVMHSSALLILVFLLTGCGTWSPVRRADRDVLTQVSVIDALLKGVYDGEVTCGELRKMGDLGIGTFNGLDGELLLVDGVVYQVRVNGSVIPARNSVRVPFATVTWFESDLEFDLADKTYAEMQEFLTAKLPSENWFYAVRLRGRFNRMKTRSVPGQEKPYPPLTEVVKQQAVFEMENIEGTLVGFWSPPFVKGVNVPGYHMHFLSNDRFSGGHVLDFELSHGLAELDITRHIEVLLPAEGDFLTTDLTADLTEDLHKVETDRK